MAVSLSTVSDSDLIKRIRASDSPAFEELFYRYYQSLRGFLLGKFNLPADISRDLIQDTFVRIWQNRHTLDATRSIKSLLFQITYNLAIDHLRKRKRLSEVMLPEDHGMSDEPQAEMVKQLQVAIRELPEPLRDVVEMKWIYGYRYREIGEKLRISPRTVEGRMAKALKLLLEKLSLLLLVTL